MRLRTQRHERAACFRGSQAGTYVGSGCWPEVELRVVELYSAWMLEQRRGMGWRVETPGD